MSTPEFTGDTIGRIRELGLFELLKMRLVREVLVATPAAGASWSTVVPAGVVWEMVAVTFRLTSSAVAGTRLPSVTLSDADGRLLGNGVTSVGQAPSLTVPWVYAVGVGYPATATIAGGFAGLVAAPLQAGSVVALAPNNMDAGDQVDRIVLLVREWSPQQIAAQTAWLARQTALVSD